MERESLKGIWRHSRRAFRWLRIFVLSAVLVGAVALLILNKFGLPGFAKRPVIAALEAAGLEVEFSKLHLKGYRRIVLDNVLLRNDEGAAPIEFRAREATLRFDRNSFRRLRLQLEALELDGGTLAVGLRDTNAPDRSLVIQDIGAAIRIRGTKDWTLDRFEGEALGARWRASGSLSNVVQAARKDPSSPRRKTDWTPALRELVRTLEQVRFTSPPEIAVTLLGDFKSPQTARAGVSVRGESAATPWGEYENVFLRATISPWQTSGEQLEAIFSLNVDRAGTPWGDLQGGALDGRTLYPLTNTAAFSSVWSLKATNVSSRWISARDFDFRVETKPEGTNLVTVAHGETSDGKLVFGEAKRATFDANVRHIYPVEALNRLALAFLPVDSNLLGPRTLPAASAFVPRGQAWAGEWKIELAELKSKYGSADRFSVVGELREAETLVATDRSWGFWRHLAPLILSWRAEMTNLVSPQAKLERLAGHGYWRAPNLVLEAIDSELYSGSFHANAELDVSKSALTAAVASNFDIRKTIQVLNPDAKKWIQDLEWQRPPEIGARLALKLPDARTTTNWLADAVAATVMNGSIALGPVGFRQVRANGLTTHFSLGNSELRLPDFRLRREEGELRADVSTRLPINPIRAEVRSAVNPAAMFPLLEPKVQRELRILEFPEPPMVNGVLTVHPTNLASLNFEGALSVSNLVVRKREILDVRTAFTYTNQFVEIRNILGHRTTNEVFSADWGLVDIRKGVMHVTNGFSTTDPYVATEIIGRQAAKAIDPYRFLAPPTVRVWGTVPLKDEDDADLHFQIEGGAFKYWRFNATSARAGVHWKGEDLAVTNVQAGFYGGTMEWEGYFKFRKNEADYRFRAVATNANIAPLLTDLLQKTNHIEGTLNGILVITDAKTEDFKSWRGHGQGSLEDGFLWSIPLFGLFSEPLNAIAPGLGKSRVSSGGGTFRIEDGKVFTEDMEVRAPAFRLNYDGSVDFDGNLDATVEAQFFRDAWVVGRAVSVVLWPLAKAFKSRVSGNLEAPKSELVHIPKVMLFPFRPIQTLKEVFSDKDKKDEKESAAPEKPGQPRRDE